MLFKITGKCPRLTLHLENPIHLHNDKYGVALVGFFSDNYFNNLKENDNFYFIDSNEVDDEQIKSTLLEPGFYTMQSLELHIRRFISTLNTKVNVEDFKILKVNDHVAICSPLRFRMGPNISTLFGFANKNTSSNPVFFPCKSMVKGTLLPKFRPLEVIELHCNIVENSCVTHYEHASHKHLETEMLYTFFPAVAHGHKISHSPNHRHYVPVKRGLKTIQCINVTVMDEKHHLLDTNKSVDSFVYLDIAPLISHNQNEY